MAGVRIRRGSGFLDFGLVRVIKSLWIALLLLTASVAQAQFTFTTNNGAITITGYTGTGGAVTIPGATNGYPVTSIGSYAFSYKPSVASVTIPDSVTNIADRAFWYCIKLTNVTIGANVANIGNNAFYYCTSLTSVTIPDSAAIIGDNAFFWCASLTNVAIGSGVTHIGSYAFWYCTRLSSVTIPDNVTSIGAAAFYFCTGLTNVTVGNNVNSIGNHAFAACTNLTGVYFRGRPPTPANDSTVFGSATKATLYYLPGTTGWGSAFDGRPTALWFLPNPLILNPGPGFGVQTNGFGFTISWATNIPVVVEASTNLANPVWNPVATNTLTGGVSNFHDPRWTNVPGRFYRVRSP